MQSLRIVVLGMGMMLSIAAGAAESTGPAGRAADPHAGHNMGGPVKDGPWSYTSRKNPAPFTRDRWEMVPAPGEPMMFVVRDPLSVEERCRIARENRGQIVDRATRAACGDVPAPAPVPVKQDHSGH